MNIQKSYTLIVTAAGTGSRYQRHQNKVFDRLNGVPTVVHAIRNLEHSLIREIIVTTSQSDYDLMQAIFNDHHIDAQLVMGGASRLHSVQNALRRVSDSSDGVLIHDGARPNPSLALLDTILNASTDHAAIVPGVPITDTVKQINNSIVIQTIPRETLVAIQTPQFFQRSLFELILNYTPTPAITDEAMIVETQGIPIYVIDGHPDNLKLTRPSDKAILELLLTQR